MCSTFIVTFILGIFDYMILPNLVNLPAGVVPVTKVSAEDIEVANSYDDDEMNVPEIKIVRRLYLYSWNSEMVRWGPYNGGKLPKVRSRY